MFKYFDLKCFEIFLNVLMFLIEISKVNDVLKSHRRLHLKASSFPHFVLASVQVKPFVLQNLIMMVIIMTMVMIMAIVIIVTLVIIVMLDIIVTLGHLRNAGHHRDHLDGDIKGGEEEYIQRIKKNILFIFN